MSIPSRVPDPDAARARFGPLADRIFDHLQVGDPPADAAAEALSRQPGARGHALVDALIEGRAPMAPVPDAVRSWIHQATTPPSWIDPDRLEHGARTYRRLGLSAVAILASVSLLRGYHSSAINKPLVFAEGLARGARVRLGETGRFIHTVSAPGGLAPGGAGIAACVKVRLIHANVRRHLLASPRWDRDAWGVPINQSDLLATGISFSAAVLYAAREMGFRFSPAEAEDLLHLWRYVSSLMGTVDGLLWGSEAEAERLGELVASTQPGADDWSLKLADALRGVLVGVEGQAAPPRRWVMKAWRRYLDGLARELNGDGFADDLGIPRVRIAMLPLTRRIVRPIEGFRQWVPGATRIYAAVGHSLIDTSVVAMLGGRPVPFVAPGRTASMAGRGVAPAAKPPRAPFAGALYDYRRRRA